jgi:endo-1,4-beta-D-glucanase Y
MPNPNLACLKGVLSRRLLWTVVVSSVGLAACLGAPNRSTNDGGATGAGGAGTVSGSGGRAAASAGAKGGASSGGGSTGRGGAGPSRGPTPPTNGTNFPFPQNRALGNCIFPTNYDNDDVAAAYAKWKADLVTSNGAGGFERVQRTTSDGLGTDGATPLHSTVSEGIGYGLLIAVYMGDHTLFDGLWSYEQLHLDPNGLMNWSLDASGNVTKDASGVEVGAGGATDADEDMAFALTMADKQWGGQGSLPKSYASYAVAQVQAIWNHEVYQSKLADPGDTWQGDLWGQINISYFAPAYYRVFKKIDGGDTWDAVTETVYDTIDNTLKPGNGNTTNGLVPGWSTSTGDADGVLPFTYQYDACRTPFRIGIDWCWNNTSSATAASAINPSRAQSYVAKTSGFFSGIGVANIVDGYNLDGTVDSSAHSVAQGQSAAFVGPAAVGAMSAAAYQSFVDAAYERLKTMSLTVGGAYYDESWTVMSLLMLTGNFLDYTQLSVGG